MNKHANPVIRKDSGNAIKKPTGVKSGQSLDPTGGSRSNRGSGSDIGQAVGHVK